MSEKEDDNNNIFHDILLKYLDKKAPILGKSTFNCTIVLLDTIVLPVFFPLPPQSVGL